MSELSLRWFVLTVDVSLKTLLLAAATVSVLSVLRVRNSNVKHAVWLGVLLGMLALPLLSAILPAVRVALPIAPESLFALDRASTRPAEPIVPPTAPTASESVVRTKPRDDRQPLAWGAEEMAAPSRAEIDKDEARRSPTFPAREGPVPVATVQTMSGSAASTSGDVRANRADEGVSSYGSWKKGSPMRWLSIAMAVWFAGTLVFVLRLFLGLFLGRRLVHRARVLETTPDVRRTKSGLFLIRECIEIRVPVSTGLFGPTILLPSDWRSWSEEKFRDVLVHEETHLRRKDSLVALLADLCRCVYWFHPVAWWVRSRLAILAEEACDDATISSTGNRTAYAHHLLEFASVLSGHPGRVIYTGQSMARCSTLESRIHAILDFGRPLSQRLTWNGTLLIAAIVVPVVSVAAALRPSANPAPLIGAVAQVADKSPETEKATKIATPPKWTDETRADQKEVAPDSAAHSKPEKKAAADVTFSYAGTVVDERGKPATGLGTIFTDVTAKSGESKQLGDLWLKPGKPKAANKSSDARTTQKTAAIEVNQGAPRDSKRADLTTDKARLRLAGTVLKPNGDPAIGATVLLEGFLSQFAGGEAKWTLVAQFSADARGAFDRDFDGRWRPSDSAGVRLSAIMPGYGRSSSVRPWTNDLRSIVLRLADDEAIRARVLNLEGRPIASVRVDAVQVYPSKKEWIDRWLAEIPPHAIFSGIGRTTDQKFTQMKAVALTAPAFPAASMEMDPVAGLPSAVTDAEGKVEIRGLGRERLVLFRIVGPGIAAAKLYAMTHPTKPIEFNLSSRPVPRQVFSIYGSEFEYIAAPGLVVTGVVRDDETKKPIAGAIVASDSLEGVRTSSGGNLSATTDVEGRYRLEGLSRNHRITITVTRPNSAYLESDLEVRSSLPFEPVREDIALKRGLWAVGRAYNIKTGQPVAATLFYTPFRSNEFARKSRRSGTRGFLDDVPAGHTNGEGRFRIPILAGRGVIALRCASSDYVPAFGASKSRELSDPKTEIATFDDIIPRWFDSVAAVDLKPDAAELRIDLPVDPGQDVVFKFVDRAGHRLSGVRVAGMTPRRDLLTKTDTITIPATSPDETRIGWIKHKELYWTQHKEGGLCKFLHFKPIPGERERTITLEPPAVLTGRLVSPSGEPLRDVSIDCSYEVGYNSVGGFPQARTDAQGRFRYEIPGGGPFQVASRSGSFLSVARELTVQSGEQVDFGELVVSASDRIRSTVTAKHPPKRTLSPAPGLQAPIQRRH